jgi:ferritin-like metal-binding protein YciE
VRDAAVIAAARRIEHYEMAAYGCARAYAATLGDHAAAEILNQILQEEREMDQRLMALAEKGIAENATTPIPAVWVTDATGLFPTPKTWPE